MELQELTEALNECLDYGDKTCFSEKIDLLLNQVNEERATELLATYLYNRYTSYKADSIAGLMEIIIRKNLNVGLVNFPDNNLYRVAVLHGSVNLFDCYLEEFCQPFLKKNESIDAVEFYIALVSVVNFYKEKEEEILLPLVKGMDFNGAFGELDEYPNAVLINKEDYEVMNTIVEKYNAIVGRMKILKKLNQIVLEL
jgi:hypothetical protein